MTSYSFNGTMLGVAVIFLVLQFSDSRSLRRHHGVAIRRGHQAVSQQQTTYYHFDIVEMLGMYLGGVTIKDSTIKNLENNITNLYTSANCKEALEKDYCNTAIARHNGQFRNHYGRHYYGNSVTRPSALTNNDIETTYSRQTRSSDCITETVFDCSLTENEKEAVREKCNILDLFGASKKTNSLHYMSLLQNKELKWSHISTYLRRLGDKLLSSDPNASVNSFYENVYDEIKIKCRIGNIAPDTVNGLPNVYYELHADLLKNFTIRFHNLKHATDSTGKSYNCFDNLLEFMQNMTTVAMNDILKKPDYNKNYESWEDIMHSIVWREWMKSGSELEKLYQSGSSHIDHKVHFCSQKILVQYSYFIRERAEMIKTIKEEIEKKGHSSNSVTFARGALYGMTDKIFTHLSRLLYKTYLITNPLGRLSIVTENEKVTSAVDYALTNIKNTTKPENNPKRYWKYKMKSVERQLLKQLQELTG